METAPLTSNPFPIKPAQPLSFPSSVTSPQETVADTPPIETDAGTELGVQPTPEVRDYASDSQNVPPLAFPQMESSPSLSTPSLDLMDWDLGQPEEDHVYQYGEASESDELTARQEARERQANCGPASAAIILNRLDVAHGDLHSLREDGDAVTGDQRSAQYGIDPNQLIQMVQVNAARESREVEAKRVDLPTDGEQALDTIQQALDDGYQVVLRTGNMDSNGRGGHFVVVNSITPPPDRQLNVSDPQNEDGASQLESLESFEQALTTRSANNRANDIMIFKDVTQPN